MILGLPPAPYLECQPSKTALEQNILKYLTSLAQCEVNSVNWILKKAGMYQDVNAASNMLTLPTPHSITTPVTTALGFHPIGGTPPITQVTQSTQVSHMQALNLLESQSMTGSVIRKLTPVNVTDPSMAQVSSNTPSAQEKPITPVSFVSTTQVQMDTAVPPPVSQASPQVVPVWVPLLQITSVASNSNVALSLMSQQMEMTGTSQNQQWTESQCRKYGKKNHQTTCCHKKVVCKKCNGKDHSTKYCVTATSPEPKCTYYRKGKHTTENCKARKKAKKKLERESRAQ